MVTRKTASPAKAPAPKPVRRVVKKSAPAAKPKAAAPAKSAKVAAPAVGVAKAKTKLVRDSFTIPKSEYVVLDDLKLRATMLMRPAKKGELLRAGIVALGAMSDAAFLATLAKVPNLKTGRPKRPKPPGARPAAEKA